MFFDVVAVSAAILLNSRIAAAQDDGTPCASVSAMSASFASDYPRATTALVPADAAEACLKSVPIDKEEDLELIKEMRLYINWQSNLGYLLEPPEGYNEERVDTLDAIERITQDLEDDKYDDEYTLMSDLATVLVKSYDFHFGFTPDISTVFQFARGNVADIDEDFLSLVSISEDGKELPKLYNYFDVILSEGADWSPSAITEINNQTAADFLDEITVNFVYHEDHARYNRLFPNQAQLAVGDSVNQFVESRMPIGAETTITHENGTTKTYTNVASVPEDAFDFVDDGESFFLQFCNQEIPEVGGSFRKRNILNYRREDLRDLLKQRLPGKDKVKRQSNSSNASDSELFPEAEIEHSEGLIAGYYLTGNDYEDVAVLAVPSFSPESEDGIEEFQDLIGSFLQDAKDEGKSRLVIDLRGNGGGSVFLGYDLFKQLFPSEDPFGASQFRANKAFDPIGQALADAFDEEGITYDEVLRDFRVNGIDSTLAPLWQSIFNYRLPIKTNGDNFTSWEEFYGPHERNNDRFTTVSRKDLNNPFSDDLILDVTGYGTRQDDLNREQPFESDNIVLLQDGGCGSTCAVFSEFMKTQGNVQQIVVGGKPETGPMQGVAGSKGSQVYSWTQINQQALIVYVGVPSMQEEFNNTDVGSLLFAERPLRRSAYSTSGQTLSGVNLRDNIRMGDDSVTPLEFVYEAADCRLFYTADMVRKVENVWKKTADARWGGNMEDVCVEGSVGHESSLSGGFEVNRNDDEEDVAGIVGVSKTLMAAMVGVVALWLM